MSKEKIFRFNLRTYVEDTDYGGVVYHTNYLKYMERARTEYLISLGYSLPELEKKGLVFVIFKVQIEYLRPAKLNEMLTITAEVAHLGNSSATFSQTIMNADDPDHLYSRAEIKLACIDPKTHRPIFIPKFLREILQ